MSTILSYIEKKYPNKTTFWSFKVFPICDLANGLLIHDLVEYENAILEYFKTDPIIFENFDNVIDYLFCYIYGLKIKDLKCEIEKNGIDCWKKDFQDTVNKFLSSKISQNLTDIFNKSLNGFIKYFSKTDHWTEFFNSNDEKIIVYNYENLASFLSNDKYEQIILPFLDADLPKIGEKHFSLIHYVISKLLQDKKTSLGKLIFSEKYFDKFFDKHYIFNENPEQIMPNFFDFISRFIVAMKKYDYKYEEKVTKEIFSSFDTILNNLKKCDCYTKFQLIPLLKKFNSEHKIHKNFVEFENTLKDHLKDANNDFLSTAKKITITHEIKKEDQEMQEKEINDFGNKEKYHPLDFIGLTHKLSKDIKKIVPYVFSEPKNKPALNVDIFKTIIVSKNDIVFFDDKMTYKDWNNIEICIMVFDIYFLKKLKTENSKSGFYAYINSAFNLAAEKSLLLNYQECVDLIVNLFNTYFNYLDKIENLSFLLLHSLLSEICMVLEFLLRSINIQNKNFYINRWIPQLSDLLDSKKCEFFFISENERNLLQFYFSKREKTKSNETSGFDLRNKTIHYSYSDLNKKEVIKQIHFSMFLFLQTINSFALSMFPNQI